MSPNQEEQELTISEEIKKGLTLSLERSKVVNHQGSSLRDINDLLSTSRAQVSQIKLIVNSIYQEIENFHFTNSKGKECLENLQIALALLSDLDDR